MSSGPMGADDPAKESEEGASTSAPARPDYRDTLRALGALIDAWGVRTARLWVSPAGVRVVVPTRFSERRYPWAQLQQMAEARARLRGQRPPARRVPTARWEVVLRLAGEAMDRAGGEYFVVEAALGGVGQAATCVVESPEGVVLSAEDAVLRQLEIARRYWRRGRRG
ncbi:MAG TPA: hypothetical protein VKZ60_20500 [Chloroflexota bacterium]|nr:hypothetical protein [Chloroflexota bacterium]